MNERYEVMRAYYDKREGWENTRDNPLHPYSLRNKIGFYMTTRLHQQVIKLLNKCGVTLSSEEVLDIGCGFGDWLRFFAELRRSSVGLTGVDILEDRLEKAKDINVNIKYLYADACNLPFKPEQFDIVSQFHVFEYFINDLVLGQACLEMERVVKKGGHIIWSDLMPIGSDGKENRGYDLKEVEWLFPNCKLQGYISSFKLIKMFGKTYTTIFHLAPKSYWLADVSEKLSFGRPSNLLAIFKKKGD